MSYTGETQLIKAEVNVSFTVEDTRHFLEEGACEQMKLKAQEGVK